MVDIDKCDDFADFLKKLIQSEGLQAGEVRELLGVNRQMVSKYLNRDSKPQLDKLRRIAAKYPLYDIKALRRLVDEAEPGETGKPTYQVLTEYGAKVGRIAEAIQDESVRFAILQLISSLERDTRKGTGTK